MPSIYQVDPSDVETFTVITNPIRSYTSSSTEGVTGSVYLFARRSTIEKDAGPDSSFVETAHDDSHIAETLRQVQWMGRTARHYSTSGSFSSGSFTSGSLTSGSFSSGSFTSGSWSSGSVFHTTGAFAFFSSSIVIFSGSYRNLTGSVPNVTLGSFVTGSMTGTYTPRELQVLSGNFFLSNGTSAVVSGTARFTGSFGNITGSFDLTGSFVPFDAASKLNFSGSYLFSGSGLYTPTGSYIPSGTYLPTGTYVPAGEYVPSGIFTPSGRFLNMLSQYLNKVNAKGMSRRKQQLLDVVRFSPPPTFNSNTLRKLIVKEQLQTYYRTTYPTAHWAYSNYNCLNFFTASTVPSDTALLYPNIEAGDGGLVFHEGYCSGTYTPSGSFSFDFYINPRYQTDAPNGQFKAGTILHLSSTYALSLVTGSSKDVNGRPVGFRLQLQLSHSADIPPSLLKATGNTATKSAAGLPPADLVFLSDDNSLWHNHWHHVVVRWGTKDINNGVGTFNIDRVDRGTFNIPSSTIAPKTFAPNGLKGEPSVLVVGNYYEGPNSGSALQANFFAADPALREGLQELTAADGIEDPGQYQFRHPLNAELHDVAMRRCYLSDYDIVASSSLGPTFLDNTFALYIPPFFVEQSPYRQFVGDHGGILITPFEEVDGSTTTPFSVGLSFGVGGHYINLENFVRDFASNTFPRLHHLSASAIVTSTNAETCNQFLYTQPFVMKRNLTVLPCDDGLFVPSFQLLASETLTRAVDDLELTELSFIHLDKMVHTSTLLFGAGTVDDAEHSSAAVSDFVELQIGHTPEHPFAATGPAFFNHTRNAVSGSDVESGAPLTVYQRTQDPSSNQVTFFDISNMFYGFRIKPGTLSLVDPDIIRSTILGADMSLTGSPRPAGPVKVSLADDGRGNVYRADCLTSQSSWNSVGNIYYDEGIVVLKSPHVYFFGKEKYELDFRGEQHVHVMKVDAFAPNNQLNSSSNPNFQVVAPNGYPNDVEEEFVYITGLNFHDRDYNVVMKSQLAQPIAKRHGDRILFKVKYDW